MERISMVVAAAKNIVLRLHRQRLDAEVARCLAQTASDDIALADEFAGTTADGV